MSAPPATAAATSSSITAPPTTSGESVWDRVRRQHLPAAPDASAAAPAPSAGPVVRESVWDRVLRERLAATTDAREQALLRGWHQVVDALEHVRAVYMRSGTKTAQRVLTLTHPALMHVLKLTDYTHAPSNPNGLAWDLFVRRWLAYRGEAERKPEDRLDSDSVLAVSTLIRSSYKVNRKEFQPLADAEQQAADVVAGWKAIITAVANPTPPLNE
jgi:hypothetical protein